MGWTTNSIMEWQDPRPTSPTYNQWVQISDHGRSPLSVAVERIENKQRMADGTLRRYVVSKKRTWTASWENLPDKQVSFLANGQPGNWMEQFHNEVNGEFKMRIRTGSDEALAVGTGGSIVSVMITDFSKEIAKRGKAFDLLSMDLTLEEV